MDRPTESFFDHSSPDAPYVERDERQKTVFRVGALTMNGRRELCIIRNISAKGMLIKTYSDVVPGTRMAIELKQGEMIDGTVRWADAGSAGVEFDQTIEVEAILAQDPDAPRPRMPRIDIDVPITLRDGARIVRAQARDISQGGLRVEWDGKASLNADVVVTLDGLMPKAAVVKWSDGHSAGLGFNKVIGVSELVNWLHEAQRADPHH